VLVTAVALLTPLTAAAAAGVDAPARKVVFVGVTGLRLDDVGMLTTPALWSLTRDGAVGTLVARSLRASACPADGWLAVSAGARAADLVGTGTCRTLRLPGTDGVVPGWGDYVQSATTSTFEPRLGLLGDTLATAGIAAAGIGPGAAIALANSSGHAVSTVSEVPGQTADLSGLVRSGLGAADLLVVDLGSVRDPGEATGDRTAATSGPSADPGSGTDSILSQLLGSGGPSVAGPDAITDPTRADQVRTIDTRLQTVLDAARSASADVTVVVASIADSGRRPHLQLAAAAGPGAVPDGNAFAGALLASRSTRQPGYVQITDLTPTLLSALGARADSPSGALVGAPVTAEPGPALAGDRVAAMIDEDRHAQAVRPLTERFYLGFVIINLTLYALVSIGLNGRFIERRRRFVARFLPARTRGSLTSPSRADLVLRLLRLIGVAVSTIPLASFLANLIPWWRAAIPSYAVVALTMGWMAVVTAVALGPRWRRWPLGPIGVAAGITTVVLAVDITTGARLQISALMGVQPLVGARFYGFNNTAFALFAAATVLLAAALANPLVRRGRRGLAVAVIVAVGVVATALDGLPGLGSDFGGPPALVPAFAALALLAGGVRLTWKKVATVLAAGAGAVIGFSVLDWLRPVDSRTHLGRFVQTVLDGGVWPVIQRKASQNLNIFAGSVLTLLAVGGVVLVLVVLLRPLRAAAKAADGGPYSWLSSGTPFTQLSTDAPMVRPALTALTMALGIGALVNDSGVVILAVGIGLAVPLLVAVCANWLLGLRSRSLAPTP
jgi:hypothetical protein